MPHCHPGPARPDPEWPPHRGRRSVTAPPSPADTSPRPLTRTLCVPARSSRPPPFGARARPGHRAPASHPQLNQTRANRTPARAPGHRLSDHPLPALRRESPPQSAFNELFYATAMTLVPVLFLAMAVQGSAIIELPLAAERASGRPVQEGRRIKREVTAALPTMRRSRRVGASTAAAATTRLEADLLPDVRQAARLERADQDGAVTATAQPRHEARRDVVRSHPARRRRTTVRPRGSLTARH